MATKQAKFKDWEQFEHEVRQLVEAFGYQAETTQPSHDYGVDVIAYNQRRKLVVQCKLYGKGRIGGEVITQLAGSRQFYEATNAILITTSRFTKQASEIATKLQIQLVDREKLLLLCRERNLTIPSLTVLAAEEEYCVATDQAKITIGREPTNSVVIKDGEVSRYHAVIERKEVYLSLSDCGSTNGTYLNDLRITRTVLLNYNDVVRLGKHTLRVGLQLKTE